MVTRVVSLTAIRILSKRIPWYFVYLSLNDFGVSTLEFGNLFLPSKLWIQQHTSISFNVYYNFYVKPFPFLWF